MARGKLFLKLSAWGLILTAALHATSHLAGTPEPVDDRQRQLHELMTTYRVPLPGGSPTTMDLLTGFSLTFTACLFFTGLLALVLVRAAGDPVVRPTAILYAAMSGVLVGISLRYFFVIPTACLGIVFLSSLASVATLRRSG